MIKEPNKELEQGFGFVTIGRRDPVRVIRGSRFDSLPSRYPHKFADHLTTSCTWYFDDENKVKL